MLKKLFVFFFAAMLCAWSVNAQDVITKTDGTTILANVKEIGEAVVKYHKYENPTGPLYTISVASIVKIQFKDGNVETFSQSIAPDVNQSQIGTVSDQELIKINDALNGKRRTIESDLLRAKAKKTRVAGISIGSALMAGGVAMIIVGTQSDYNDEIYDGLIGGGCAVAAAGITTLAICCVQANKYMNKAKGMEMYNLSMASMEIGSIGKSTLMTSVDLMGIKAMQTNGVGVSVSLKF